MIPWNIQFQISPSYSLALLGILSTAEQQAKCISQCQMSHLIGLTREGIGMSEIILIQLLLRTESIQISFLLRQQGREWPSPSQIFAAILSFFL